MLLIQPIRLLKHIILPLIGLFFFGMSYAQEYGRVTRIGLVVQGKAKFPDILLQPVEGGDKIKSAILTTERKYPNKPTLIIAWSKEVISCVGLIDSVVDNGLAKKYNVISFNVEESLTEVNSFIRGKKWADILHFQLPPTDFISQFGLDKIPAIFILNKDMEVIDSYGQYPEPSAIARTLYLIDNGKIDLSGSRFFYESTLTDEQHAEIYATKLVEGSRTIISSFDAKTNMLIRTESYAIKNGRLVSDGPFKIFWTRDTIRSEGMMANGSSLWYKQWFRNGTLSHDVSFPPTGPGYAKEWKEDGSRKLFYTYLDRLVDGVHSLYENNNKTESFFNKGILLTQKKYHTGIQYRETTYANDKPVKDSIISSGKKLIIDNYISSINALLKKFSNHHYLDKKISPVISATNLMLPGKNSDDNDTPSELYSIKLDSTVTIDRPYNGKIYIHGFHVLYASAPNSNASEIITLQNIKFYKRRGYSSIVSMIIEPSEEKDGNNLYELMKAFLAFNNEK